MKKLLLLLLMFVLFATAIKYRFRLLLPMVTPGEAMPLIQGAPTVPGSIPFQDGSVFVTLQLDEFTYAIAEPTSWPRNFNYLFVGSERALLFDAGIGHYDIRPVVASITDLPIVFMPSHFHYDHTGNQLFESIALIDLPHLREQADGDNITPTWEQHLGSAEAIPAPTWRIDEWVRPGASIELGDRELVLLYTPGHTDNSVSIYDATNQRLFTGDYLSKNRISAYYPSGSLGDYLQTAGRILNTISRDTQLYGAHAQQQPDLPVFQRQDIEILKQQLERIKSGELKGHGIFPKVYSITEAQVIQTNPRWLQNWQPTYPEFGG